MTDVRGGSEQDIKRLATDMFDLSSECLAEMDDVDTPERRLHEQVVKACSEYLQAKAIEPHPNGFGK